MIFAQAVKYAESYAQWTLDLMNLKKKEGCFSGVIA
jgi:hypothetical protein